MKPDWQSDDGRVRLYRGDCLEVLPFVGKVDAVVTDPPYGMDYQSARSRSGPRFDRIAGDDAAPVEWFGLIQPPKCAFVFCEWRNAEVFRSAMTDAGWPVRSQVVWDRVSHGMGDPNTVWAPRHDLAWWSCESGYSFPAGRPASVLRFDRVPTCDMTHPTQKPVALMEYIVSHITSPGETVLDPFAGSGTTGVACVQTGRSFVGIELDRGYFDIAVRRIKDAIVESKGGPLFAEKPEDAALFP
jgi:DNA modification methylase